MSNEPLLQIIRIVRRRWRVRLALRGVAIVVTAGVVVFLISAYGMDKLRFTSTAVTVFRVLAWGTVVALAVRCLALPFRRRVTDQQVALYLEEHEPSLDGQLSSAIEFAGRDDGPSRALVERLVERALQRSHAVYDGRRVEHTGLMRSGGWLAGATLAGLVALLLNPAFLRHSVPFLLSPFGGGGSGNPYAIDVLPGDSTVARGSDLRVTARLLHFDADQVELAFRTGTEEWERWPMNVDEDDGGFVALLFALNDATEYFVEAGGVRSPVFRIAVADLPWVDRIDLEYHYPAYTGLSVRQEEDGGDIAALVGTEIRLSIVPTLATSAGIVVANGDTTRLAPLDGRLVGGRLTVRESGSYRVLLAAADGRLVPASPEYFIDALLDLPPIVSFATPGRDVSVTAVDEVFLETRAEDDFGVTALDLIVTVNGGPADTVSLFDGGRKHVTAGHTLYLEELDLQPGDVIAYYALASDARRGAEPAVTDIYFVNVRPYDRTYRAAEQGGGGAGGQSANVGELSQRQREVVAGTFNLLRDRARYTEAEYRDHLATLTLAQGRLREDVETLLHRMESRAVAAMDSTLAASMAELPDAVTALKEAETRLGERRPDEALPPEQRALQHLQRAESAFNERQVTRGRQGQGGGQGGQATAEELADRFELELDRMRNQYEEVQRGEQRQADAALDETLEKLRELARRQLQENERMRAQAQRGTPDAGGGRGQRRLAAETEEVARRLQRLAREQSRPDLQEAARRVQDAVNQMRRAAAQGERGTAQGTRALDQLRDARRQLEQGRSAGLERDVRQALERVERLQEQQRDVGQRVQELPEDPAGRQDQLRSVFERKDQMAAEVNGLEAELDRLSRDARQQNQDEAADHLRGAAAELRDRRLRDKILYSRGVAQQRNREYARNFEEQIGADLEDLRERLERAAGEIGETREQRLGRALDRTRDAAQALESLTDRIRDASGRHRAEGEPTGDGNAERPAGGGAGRLDPNAQRQFQRELRERMNELRDLRDQFGRDGVDVSGLDQVIRQFGRWDNQGAAGDPRGLEALEQAVVQGLREFEFTLRRQLLDPGADGRFLAGSDEVPAEYRDLVEEYYKRLAERRR